VSNLRKQGGVWRRRIKKILSGLNFQAFFVFFNPTHDSRRKKMALEISSTAFSKGEMIPIRYTCDGPDVSPDLSWSGVPETAKSLALICDDPDAPMGTWVHWVLFNIPSSASGLPAEIPSDAALENGARHGTNDFGRLGYGGPCPPGGTHRYYFKLYALDAELNRDSGVTKAELLEAMDGHVIAEGQLMGTYKR
jgi:Raf kinase inhibitor-like YbhB/YbcL family protein